MERIFTLIAKHVDHSLPVGEFWHSHLLQQMASDLPDVRPSVIKAVSFEVLDEFRSFRHLARNIYPFNLIPEDVGRLTLILIELWSELRSELFAFAKFLEELAI